MALMSPRRELVATYDVDNGVTRVVDLVFDTDLGELAPTVVARGTDSGLQYSFDISNLTNYTDYFYGVSAYSFNEESTPKVIESSPTQIVVRPSGLVGGDRAQAAAGDPVTVNVVSQIGTGSVEASVVNPTAITGDTYQVEFFANPDGSTNYRIVDVTTGVVKLDGAAFFQETGESLPIRPNVAVIDGISFSLLGPEPGPILLNPANPPNLTNLAFVEVVGAGWCRTSAPRGHVARLPPGGRRPRLPVVQQHLRSTSCTTVARRDRRAASAPSRRMTTRSGSPRRARTRFHAFSTGRVNKVPFEVWDIGVVPPGTENDPSDDVRMIPIQLSQEDDSDASECTFEFGDQGDGWSIFGIGTVTDAIYAYYPTTTYEAYEAEAAAAAGATGCSPGYAEAADLLIDYGRGRPIQRILFEDGGIGSVEAMEGAVIRFYTVDPTQPGSVFAVNTSDASFIEGSAEDAVAALEQIQVVPNPYLGSSTYETGNLSRVVRFTNLPRASRHDPDVHSSRYAGQDAA